MPTKAEQYAQMADQVARQLTGSWQEWAGFLTTAARLYKYPFHEQMMIYAQRPDATACAEYDLWNNRMGRYVRRGSKGIALVDDSGDRPRLRYVFDISDTGTREHSRTPWLWTLNEEHTAPVMAMLERNYDVSGGDLAQQLADVAAKLAEEYWADHRRDILPIVDGSFLEEYDEYNIEVQFKSAATVSITYALMSRCGLEPEQYFSHEDFMPIFDFNTPAVIGALGTAVSQANQQVLRQIGVTIQNYERAKSAERSVTHGEQPDLHSERGLPDPRPAPERAADEAPGQVRQDAQSVPEAAPAHPVQPAADDREVVPAPSGDRRDGTEPSGTDDAAAGRGGGRDGGAESRRPDAVGGPDEHLQSPGRGNSDGGTYQQLTLNLFLSEAEQIQQIDEAESVKTPSAFSFAQADIDHVLRLGGNTDRFRERVAVEFEKQKPISEIAAYLPTLYHGGSGVGSVTAWYTEDGIHLSHGKFARYDRAAQLLSWQDAAERIGQLLEAGQFASNVELAEAESYERSLLADEFWSLYHDLSEEARNAGYLQSLSHIQGNGFPEESAWLTGQLANPAFRAALLDEYQQFLTAHQDNRALLRFHYHHLEGMLARLRDLDLPRKTFSTELAEVPSVKRFITEDEIDAALTSGSGMAGGKGRIFAFFQESHTDKEKVDFLKHEYGIGGRSHALSGAAGSDEWYDGKGLRFKKAGCPDVHLTWDKAAKRITGLIQQGRYLSAQEQAELEQRQEEADLAEADAMAAQQAELSIQDSLEQYKPIVRTALEADTAYRNACGHSDHENAVIEGNAAVRRAVLNSGDLELIRLYSDVPEFRHRLHREVIDETYPHLHELLRPLSQDDIDDALRAWNGNADSKRAVIHYMEAHAREKDTAAWLAREFNGSDGKTLFAVRPDSPEGTALPWPKVQRRIAQLIQENKFLTEQERQPEENEQDARRYQVVVYHHFENGFDERLEYPTLEEAEKVAQGYVDGTMEPDGFAYDGAAIYDLEQRTYLRIIGNYPDEAAQAQVARLDLSGQPITREGDTLTIGSGEPTHEMDIAVSDEEYEAIRQAIPETEAPTAYDPATPPYHVGDTVYLDNQEYQITELREDTVQLLPSDMAYPIYRVESRERFETLLRADTRNEAINEFLPVNPDTADQDLRDVLVHGLIGAPDKAELSELLHTGKPNREIAQWLGRAFPGIVETMELETGDTADYRTTSEGIELEVLDAEEKRLAMLYFRWDEVAPLLRGLYARQLDGFGREQAEPAITADTTVEEPIEPAKPIEEPATEAPAFHSDPVTVYPGEQNHLPYDVVVERLHVDQPEPTPPEPTPDVEPGEKPEHPVAIPVNGEWQTFPNQRTAEQAAYQEYRDNLRRNAQNFHITDDHLGEGGPKAKYQANVAAIKLLKYLEETTGQATPEQQEVLSRYVGWGGVPEAFDPSKTAWAKEYAELKELLTPEEYAAARTSTLNAHYTSPMVIRAIYETVERLGFHNGNILEPSCGVGNFFGMLPDSMAGSRLYGVELDSITGRIARQLYPNARIEVNGFEKTQYPDGIFDLAIGNVPFGNYRVSDRPYDRHNLLIHDYFFAKAIDKVRAGGIIAFITSNGISGGTMDKKDAHAREYMARRCDLLGAVRLPNTTFRANAGTDIAMDIVFLQKREVPRMQGEPLPEWVETDLLHTNTYTDKDGRERHDHVTMNRYFRTHPEMVLGDLDIVTGPFGPQLVCNPREGADLEQQLREAMQHIQGRYTEAALPELGEGEDIDESLPADPNVKNYSYTVVDGAVYFRENSRMVRPDLNATAEARVKGLVGLRDCVQRLIDLEMDAAAPDADIRAQMAELNRRYDDFSAKYGLINDRANRLAFADDSSYYLLCALEVLDEDGRLERKADMFTKRTIKPHEAVTTVDTASEALAVSISEKACVDMAYMEQLTGKTGEELAAELRGVIFRLPGPVSEGERPQYVTADEYLSGNVRRKLRQAQRAAEQDSAFAVNVEALTAAQPKDLDASEIEVRLGATWIDKEYIQQFMYETFDTPFYLQRSIEVHYTPFTAEWQISGKNVVGQNNVAAYSTYGTGRANAYKILEDSLNLRDVRIYDTVEDADGKERRVLNAKETTLAAQKQQAIRDAFRDWIWRDPGRRQALVRQYNEEMNATRPREYDGSHIVFGGMNPAITLRDHQKNAIAHVLYGGNTLLAHEVGAGKTFEMVGAAMEAKRLGLCQKSLFVVPNHLTEQWASEFLRLYPSANILVTTKKDFEKHNRKKFCARIATGDYDAIIMGHSQFEKIPISKERQERLLHEQIWEITEGIAEVEASGGERFTVKQLERTKKSLEARLEKLQAEGRKDDVVTFEQLGVDRLFVDEAHNYKNLFLYTKMRNVAGLSTTDAQKASDMFAKCRYMDEITGSRGVIFATGTPVSNSMTELYTMQRYLQYDRLQELGMAHFDCWASRFGETVTALELAPEGTGYRARTRFSKFFNLPELMNLFKEVADIKTADQLHLPTPQVEYHNIVAQPTEQQQEMVKALSERASLVHSGTVDPSQDNMLKITSDGRKLGLDQRIINQLLPDEPGTKVNQCVNNIMQIWRDGEADKLTQLVFCDISTPQARPAKKVAKALDNPTLHALENAVPLDEPEPAFTVYEDIRQKLIAQGVPAEQIAFIHEANTEVRKKELFSKVRTGQVRVLLGSTAKMGAGTNVQDRLVALHDLDCPWRPGDLAQRKGRIERQGNQNETVHVYRYVTEGTFDAYLWQTVENKQKFISQIMTSKSPVRSCDDVDETALSFAEIKALCAGDPRIKERMDLDVDVARLKLMKADHQSKQYRLEDQLLKTFPEEIEKNKGFIAGLEADMATLAAHPHPEDGFAGMEVRGDTLTDKENAGAALLDACKEVKGADPVPVGSYRGFTMSVSFDAFRQEYMLLLKGQMTHRATLGTDPRGNLTRIDNALSQMPQRLEAVKNQLDNLYQQQAAAKAEVGKPFPFEDDLRVKSARLAELDVLLNMDGRSRPAPETMLAKSSRPSVLEGLKRPVPRNPEKKPKHHEQEVR